jgi:hypothetical protein
MMLRSPERLWIMGSAGEGGPLAKICTFSSYDAVEELSAKSDLKFMKDTIVEEYEEVME